MIEMTLSSFTLDLKFAPWRSEAEPAASRSRRLPTILSHVDGEETFFVSFKPPRPGTEPRAMANFDGLIYFSLSFYPIDFKPWHNDCTMIAVLQFYAMTFNNSQLIVRIYSGFCRSLCGSMSAQWCRPTWQAVAQCWSNIACFIWTVAIF